MELNFSHHRLNNFLWLEEYRQRIGFKTLFQFIDTVYGWLLELNPGERLILSNMNNITNQNRDLFIKTTCLFISEGHLDYEFSKNYTEIIRRIERQAYGTNTRKQKKDKALDKK